MTGPWIDHVLVNLLNCKEYPPIRLVRGSYILVPKLYTYDRSYIFQNGDKCIIFTMPHQEEFTFLGITDCNH
ncbi:hypothetical protein MCY_00859 [Bartonella rattimassiliensis 15908]|uniref:Uncharacterized protein n=1 Tax=Bartonella rattimassiliensis 15908 TaxID=1094556 RepID=J0QKE8_9HYPH|nr:hypothetical protein MCY_00859 [Bartonella rattimassiliensis 15908]